MRTMAVMVVMEVGALSMDMTDLQEAAVLLGLESSLAPISSNAPRSGSCTGGQRGVPSVSHV
jgi:hypothetical protein